MDKGGLTQSSPWLQRSPKLPIFPIEDSVKVFCCLIPPCLILYIPVSLRSAIIIIPPDLIDIRQIIVDMENRSRLSWLDANVIVAAGMPWVVGILQGLVVGFVLLPERLGSGESINQQVFTA